MKGWLTVLLLFLAGAAGAESWRFALIGDTPYSSYERQQFPALLEAIADSNVEFVVHIGDFKSGQSRCDDALFEDRKGLFEASRIPFIFVPGDNEWTDCERLSCGAYNQLERLDKLRQLFWSNNQSLGKKRLTLDRQAGGYPEHARWRLGPVLFVTLNVPGGNNWGLTDTPSAEYLARNPAVLAWIKENFALAREEKLAGVVLLMQADPAFKHFRQGLGHRAYRELLDTLRSETQAYAGQVVLVHGDSHSQRQDQPLHDRQGKPIANFTRVETYGYPVMGWTEARLNTEGQPLFTFTPHPWPTPQIGK